MNVFLLLKAGFSGFALSLGALMLVFYVVGAFLRVTERNFLRVFMLAGIASFVATYVFLHLKIAAYQESDAMLFLAGCVGGWLSGILSGLTHMKRLLLWLRR
ncbi:MAG: hypothetical protein HY912_21350 [Desulfomonile tiedjei]|uniref:Uncharacterized protein n=1 Tax=Desulfomonile tiedjei TaxID=2358 RepID=A0A9D6V5T7_9BACT|nr:hypothetical protein [Desulfomonile tiedjei]